VLDNCVNRYCKLQKNECTRAKQFRTVLISKREARGAMHSRYHEEVLTNNEEFCFETDSHVQAVKV
jgi:hypothetical protein